RNSGEGFDWKKVGASGALGLITSYLGFPDGAFLQEIFVKALIKQGIVFGVDVLTQSYRALLAAINNILAYGNAGGGYGGGGGGSWGPDAPIPLAPGDVAGL